MSKPLESWFYCEHLLYWDHVSQLYCCAVLYTAARRATDVWDIISSQGVWTCADRGGRSGDFKLVETELAALSCWFHCYFEPQRTLLLAFYLFGEHFCWASRLCLCTDPLRVFTCSDYCWKQSGICFKICIIAPLTSFTLFSPRALSNTRSPSVSICCLEISFQFSSNKRLIKLHGQSMNELML